MDYLDQLREWWAYYPTAQALLEATGFGCITYWIVRWLLFGGKDIWISEEDA